MLATAVVPCPTGWINLDTYRLFETLESGCVPVLCDPDNSYYAKAYPGAPFIIVKSWDKLSGVRRIIKRPKDLDALTKKCFEWWKNYKKRVIREFKTQLDAIQP